MHGLIHDCLRDLVQKNFGMDKWFEFLEFAQSEETTDFAILCPHNDDLTYHLVGKASEFLGAPLAAVLEQFGGAFYHYCKERGYAEMLRTIGRDVEHFLSNLDFHHFFISSYVYGSAKTPSFKCERPDPDDASQLLLQYSSQRPSLYPIVIGITREAARDIFSVDVEISIKEAEQKLMKREGDVDVIHYRTLFLIKIMPKADSKASQHHFDMLDAWHPEKRSSMASFKSYGSVLSVVESFTLGGGDLNRLLPFHLAFDVSMIVVSVGHHLRQLKSVRTGDPVGENVQILYPKVTFSWHDIMAFIHAHFVLKIKTKAADKRLTLDNDGRLLAGRDLQLKGQMFVSASAIVFVGSPHARSLEDLTDAQIYLSDIPLHDVTRELTLLNQQRLAEVELSKELESTTAELKKVSHQLKAEKQKTDDLLHEMLPRQIADSLKEGREVQACSFELVSIMFSDIVKFTVISSRCQPKAIVNLLNELFTLFDDNTSKYDLYKVETIGDAYMMAGGIPIPTEDHCVRIVQASLEMSRLAVTVKDPIDGSPINIRVGIHCGAAMAGVVGRKMPRYCLFGDTVNTASRMESHGVAGKVHISAAMETQIAGLAQFVITFRGDMNIKGKGQMRTYFVEGTEGFSNRLKETVNGADESKKVITKSLPPKEATTRVCTIM